MSLLFLNHILVFAPVLLVLHCVSAQGIDFFPSSEPLAVRSPYLWTALPSEKSSLIATASTWPSLYSGVVCISSFSQLSRPTHSPDKSVGWTGFIRIDGINYRWLGANDAEETTSCDLTARQTTPTRTILQYKAGSMNLTVTYLSPIEVR